MIMPERLKYKNEVSSCVIYLEAKTVDLTRTVDMDGLTRECHVTGWPI
jgi:hypothetical protein